MIKTKEEIQQELDNLFNGNITYLDDREQFLTNKDKLLFKCSIHGEFRRRWHATRTSKWGCPICGKQIGYENSQKVREYKYGVGGPLANTECREKGKATLLEKYGVYNSMQSEEIQAKAKQTCLERYGCEYALQNHDIREKGRLTLLKKYGVENAFNMEQARKRNIESLRKLETKRKRDHTKLIRYGNAQYNNRPLACKTNTERHGVPYPMQSAEIRNKSVETCMQKYGVRSWTQSEAGHARLSESASDPRTIQKQIETMKREGTFKISKSEQLFESLLQERDIEYKTEYVCERYPFKCDFYLPEWDLFVELNVHWTHNNHFYDEEADKEEANKLLNKSKYYLNAHTVWTKRDIQKKNCAKENKLNYVVLWNNDDIHKWFNDGCPIRQDYN